MHYTQRPHILWGLEPDTTIEIFTRGLNKMFNKKSELSKVIDNLTTKLNDAKLESYRAQDDLAKSYIKQRDLTLQLQFISDKLNQIYNVDNIIFTLPQPKDLIKVDTQMYMDSEIHTNYFAIYIEYRIPGSSGNTDSFTIHTYNTETKDKILKTITEHYKDIKTIVDAIN